GLHEDICKDGAHRDAYIVLLLAVVRNIGAEGKRLQDDVCDSHRHRDHEEDGVRVDEDLLNHFNLRAVGATGHGVTKGGLTRGLLGRHVDGRDGLELPATEIAEVKVDGKRLHG